MNERFVYSRYDDGTESIMDKKDGEYLFNTCDLEEICKRMNKLNNKINDNSKEYEIILREHLTLQNHFQKLLESYKNTQEKHRTLLNAFIRVCDEHYINLNYYLDKKKDLPEHIINNNEDKQRLIQDLFEIIMGLANGDEVIDSNINSYNNFDEIQYNIKLKIITKGRYL